MRDAAVADLLSPTMPSPEPPSADLMPSLGRLVRGLIVLFWCLPVALVVSVQTARTSVLGAFGPLLPLTAHGLLFYGLTQLGHFRRQERVWVHALDRAKLIALVNVGLSPFLHWWRLMPDVLHFQLAVTLMAVTGLLFVFTLNLVLQRLAAMLPDETLRLEAHLFTNLNIGLLAATLLLAGGGAVLLQWNPGPAWLALFARIASHAGLLVLLILVLLPLALTMTLVWKIKEAILASVFGPPPG